MTQDDIIRIAREAGMQGMLTDVVTTLDELSRFAALVAQHEREACAKVCDNFDHPNWDFLEGASLCASAIRARGEQGGNESC
jgi:hypothetical protein